MLTGVRPASRARPSLQEGSKERDQVFELGSRSPLAIRSRSGRELGNGPPKAWGWVAAAAAVSSPLRSSFGGTRSRPSRSIRWRSSSGESIGRCKPGLLCGWTHQCARGRFGRLNGLRVIPPAATLTYRGRRRPLEEMGKTERRRAAGRDRVARGQSRGDQDAAGEYARGRDLWTHTLQQRGGGPACFAKSNGAGYLPAQVHASAPDRARMIDTRKLDPRVTISFCAEPITSRASPLTTPTRHRAV